MLNFPVIDCGPHPAVSHAVIAGDTFHGGTPIITCDSGYTKTGTATCGANGNWVTDVQCTISKL